MWVVLGALGVALVGFFAPMIPITAGYFLGGEETNFGLVVLFIRVLALGLGFGMYQLAHPHVRGHEHLGGQPIPFQWLIGGAFVWIFLVPRQVQLMFEMPILALLMGLA